VALFCALSSLSASALDLAEIRTSFPNHRLALNLHFFSMFTFEFTYFQIFLDLIYIAEQLCSVLL